MRKGEIDIIILGCSKNLVDAERLMRQLELAGYRCVHDSANPKGEIAIINTCGFIGDAKEESIDIILQFAERKTKGKLRKLYVMGCLSQRYREELPAEIPEVDKWFGKFDYLGIVEELKPTPTPSLKGREPKEERRKASCILLTRIWMHYEMLNDQVCLIMSIGSLFIAISAICVTLWTTMAWSK